LSDVTISSRASLRGFDDVAARLRDVEAVAGDMIEAITPTVTTPGLLSYEIGAGEVITRQVQIVGIDAVTNEKVTSIAQYLQHPDNRAALSFDLREDGYDVQNPLFGSDGTIRTRLEEAGWKKRRADAKYEKYRSQEQARRREIYENTRKPDSAPPTESEGDAAANPYEAVLRNFPKAPTYEPDEVFDEPLAPEASDAPGSLGAPFDDETAFDEPEDDSPSAPTFVPESPLDEFDEFDLKIDKETTQETGAIIGVGVVSGAPRKHVNPDTGKTEIRESLSTIPGADVTLSFLAVGAQNSLPSIVYDRFTIVDFYECRMAEYDNTFVFVPIEKLQELRGMIAADGSRMATHILIKAKPGVKIEDLRDKLQNSEEFPEQLFDVETWKDQQATT
ncbi:MAG: hypothetical protein HUK22_02730, partial [Thermoguttaceae bacterium]|nr:hypothetical protein [Thermoguttaceae bacterium]